VIRYSLRCADGHAFDSWFQSAAAFDGLQARGQLACPACGNAQVDKAPMAPQVAGTDRAAATRPPEPAEQVPERLQQLARLRAAVEARTEDVGRRFPDEARRIHNGEAPERAIRGEARPAEARALWRDGIPVVPLPFVDRKKTN